MSMPNDKGIIEKKDDVQTANETNEELNHPKSAIDPNLNLQHENPTIEERTADKKRDAVLNLIEDVTTQRQDIDKLNQSMSYIADKITQIAQVIDNQNKVLNQLSGGQAIPTTGNNVKGQLSDLINSPLGEKLMNKLMPDTTAAAPLIDQQMINDKMKASFLSNLETGESINEFIKNAMKKSVTKTIINTSLKDIGQAGASPHGPA